jgi:hypothetical protein
MIYDVRQLAISLECPGGNYFEFKKEPPVRNVYDLTPKKMFWLRDKDSVKAWFEEKDDNGIRIAGMKECNKKLTHFARLIYGIIVPLRNTTNYSWMFSLIKPDNEQEIEHKGWEPIKDFKVFLHERLKPVLDIKEFKSKGLDYNPFKRLCNGETYYRDLWDCWDVLQNYPQDISDYFEEESSKGQVPGKQQAKVGEDFDKQNQKKKPVFFDPQEVESSECDAIERGFALLPDLIDESDIKKARALIQKQLRPHSSAKDSLKDDLSKGNFCGQVRMVKTYGKEERAVYGKVLAVNFEWFCENILPQIPPIEQTSPK